MTTASLQYIFILLVVFQIKHFLADFPLQFPYMLRKFRAGWDFVFPLSLHCGTHALFTLVIVLIATPHLWWLSIFDFVVHFIMDRVKSGPRYLGRFNDSRSTSYWTVFGIDQMVHHLTHLFIIYVMVTQG